MAEQTNEFESPEFREDLKTYEDMKNGITPSCYLDSDAILDISEYYETVAKDFKASCEVLDFGLRLHPDDEEIKKYKIQNLIGLGQLDTAETMLKKLENDLQQDFEVKLIRAALCIQKQDYAKGLSIIRQTIKDTAGTEDEKISYEEAGNMLLNGNMLPIALELLEKGNKLFPQNKEIKSLYAEACQSAGQFEKAVKLYNELLDDDPYNLDNWIELARTYLSADNFEKVHESLDFANAIDDTNEDAVILRATCYYQQGIFDKAYTYYKKVYEKNPENDIAIMFASACCMNLDNDKEAAELIEEAIRQSGGLSDQYINMLTQAAIIYLRMDNYKKAMDYVEKALQQDERDTQCHILKGEIFIHIGRTDEAEKEFITALEIAEDTNNAYFQIGMAYYEAHCYREALAYYRILRDNTEEKGSAFAYMSDCYLQIGMPEEYMECLKLACIRNPHSVRTVFGDYIPDGIQPENFYEYVKQNWKEYGKNSPFQS